MSWMKRFLLKAGAFAVGGVILGLPPMKSGEAQAQTTGVRTWTAPNGTKYVFVPGQFTQQQAWAEAVRRGGHPVVFETMTEHKQVMDAFGFKSIAPCHTGHYQLKSGAEPAGGWRTYTGTASAPLNVLFNSNGPDDGATYKWVKYDDGWYRIKVGKDEDAGVIWHDNQGKLEDVSVNHKGGVMVEIKKK